MLKFIGLTFLALLIGGSVVAWSHSKGRGLPQDRPLAFSPEEIYRNTDIGSLPVEKVDDRAFENPGND